MNQAQPIPELGPIRPMNTAMAPVGDPPRLAHLPFRIGLAELERGLRPCRGQRRETGAPRRTDPVHIQTRAAIREC